MKQIVLLLIFLSFLGGCTNNSNNDHEPIKPDVVLNAGEGLITGSGEFGQLGPKDSKVLTVRITNNGTSPLQGPPIIDNTNFSIIYQSGCASILPTKRCDLKISFSAAGKSFTLYNANLNLASAFLALSAEVVDPNPTTSVSFSSSPVDFGTITNKQNSVKTITIKNTGATVINQAVVAPPVSSGFSVLYDSCSNKNISPTKTCTLKISMNGAGVLGALEADLTYGSLVTLTGQVVSSTGATALGSPDVKLLVDNVAATTYDFGTLSGTQFKQLLVTAKNLGTQASEVSMVNLLSNTNFSVLFNQCSNKSLVPNAICQMRLVFNAAGKAPGSYSDTLSFAGQNLVISGSVQSLQAQITVTLDVPPNTLMFTNQIYPPSTPGYMECNGYGETANKQCQFTFTKGTNINIELQYNRDGVEPLNWVGCPAIVPGGPGQWFCQLSTATTNFTLGMITQPVAITYQGLFTDWSDCDALVCSGSGEQSRELVGCEKVVNGQSQGPVPSFFCRDNPNELTDRSCPSPAGQKTVNITNGTKVVSCLLGSADETLVSITCDSGFNNQNNICIADIISYTADYSSYSACSASNACDGIGIQNRTIISCQKLRNGIPEAGGQISDCSSFNIPSNTQLSCNSPSGNKIISLGLSGSKTVSCVTGSSIENFISLSCNFGYIESSGQCVRSISPVSQTWEISYLDPQVPLAPISSEGTTYPTNPQIYSVPTNNLIVPGIPASLSVITPVISSLQTLTNPLPLKNVLPRQSDNKYVLESTNPLTTFLYSPQEIIDNLLSNNFITPQPPFYSIPIKKYTFSQVSNVSNGNDSPSNLTIMNNGLYFTAYLNGSNKIYKVNQLGIVFEVVGNGSVNNVGNLTAFNNELYFTGYWQGLQKLFKVNVRGDIVQVSDTRTGLDDFPSDLKVFNNELYFKSENSTGQGKLFKVNTGGEVSLAANVRNGSSEMPSNLTLFNNELYFTALKAGGAGKIFKISTSGVVSQVSHTRSSDDDPSNLNLFNNELYFSSRNSAGFYKLFKVTTSGVVSQISNTNSGNDSPSNLKAFNNDLYFSSRNASGSFKLFKVTTSGVVSQVSNINSGSDSPSYLTVFNNELYFRAFRDSSEGSIEKLFKVNSSGNITQISNTNSVHDWPDNLIVFNNELYFSSFATGLWKLFKINNTGIVSQISNTSAYNTNDIPIYRPEIGSSYDVSANFTIFNNELYFSSKNSQGFYKLFKIKVE